MVTAADSPSGHEQVEVPIAVVVDPVGGALLESDEGCCRIGREEALKPVSKWLSFQYGNTKSSATQSMLWYRLWLEAGDRQYLDDSIIYDEDDCRATAMIKGWLAGVTSATGTT